MPGLVLLVAVVVGPAIVILVALALMAATTGVFSERDEASGLSRAA